MKCSSNLTILGRAGWDLLFPPSCLSCRASLASSQVPLFCQECLRQLSWLDSPLCTCCGRPLSNAARDSAEGDHFCGLCLQKPPHFTRARAAMIYEGPITTAILACKYNRDLAGLTSFAALARRSPALAPLILPGSDRNGEEADGLKFDLSTRAGSEAGPESKPNPVKTLAASKPSPATAELAPKTIAVTAIALGWAEFDYILPVPLHLKRLRHRGFNQALVLARAFFPEAKRKIVADLLLRHRWTDPQTGMSGSQRRENLRDAFGVACRQKIKNRRILLIDDVFTTGSTVNECARALNAAGAAQVQVFTLARVREFG